MNNSFIFVMINTPYPISVKRSERSLMYGKKYEYSYRWKILSEMGGVIGQESSAYEDHTTTS